MNRSWNIRLALPASLMATGESRLFLCRIRIGRHGEAWITAMSLRQVTARADQKDNRIAVGRDALWTS
jgi:hypothetical protein